jgi:hypothetical protein
MRMEKQYGKRAMNVRDQKDISKVLAKQCKHAHRSRPRINLERREDNGQRIA